MIALLIGAAAFAFWQGSTLVDELLRLKQRKLFREDIALSLMHKGKSLTLQHVQQIAETRNVTQLDIQRTLRVLLREVLAERNLSLCPHQDWLESLLREMKDREPFEGLPSEIRIHLERLREEMPASSHKLEPLTTQIRELVALKGREYRLQKYYTVGGFILGVIGLGFAAYAYWFPVVPKP
ncbi:hypothetical protein [Cognatiluteimonas weifangensis]|uniref:hypothetical protein n=1 Tax=Cognatiluteimonas weifangensis TaxID=2303539 RepID=UPI0011C14F55|nr:hypothetical protein [Luteimonas weifangensis]